MKRTVAKSTTVALLVMLAACTPRADDPGSAEVSRIQAHLAGALSELRDAPVEHLPARQRSARLETIEWLEEYRAAGVFPHNHVLPDRATPVFVDPHGTPCAVGYLLLRSGEVELVEEVGRHENLARIPELGDDPRLGRWLGERGLTLAEATRIQPAYQPVPPNPSPTESHYDATTVGVSLVTAAAAALALLTEPDRSALPWIESLNVATAITHIALAVAGGRGGHDGAEWARNLNALGAVAGTFVAAERLVRRSSAPPGSGATVAPLVSRSDGRVDLGVQLIH